MATISGTVSNVSKLVRHAIGSALSGVHAGDEKIMSRQQATAAAQSISISSSAFTNGSTIPDEYSPQGENGSPPLAWSGVPVGAKSLTLIVEDPDAPLPLPFVHWILHGLPPTTRELPAALPHLPTLPQVGNAKQGKNDAKTIGYYGPKPPSGHGLHHYHFQLFALDAELSPGADATLADLKKAMAGHVLGEGELIGTYRID